VKLGEDGMRAVVQCLATGGHCVVSGTSLGNMRGSV
jgi:hypothetical protein